MVCIYRLCRFFLFCNGWRCKHAYAVPYNSDIIHHSSKRLSVNINFLAFNFTQNHAFQLVVSGFFGGITDRRFNNAKRVTDDFFGHAHRLINVINFNISADIEFKNIDIPSIPDELYIEGAKRRIDDIINSEYNQKDEKGISEVKNYKLIRKQLVYLNCRESYAILYSVDFTVLTKDGEEFESGLQLYYMLNIK